MSRETQCLVAITPGGPCMQLVLVVVLTTVSFHWNIPLQPPTVVLSLKKTNSEAEEITCIIFTRHLLLYKAGIRRVVQHMSKMLHTLLLLLIVRIKQI